MRRALVLLLVFSFWPIRAYDPPWAVDLAVADSRGTVFAFSRNDTNKFYTFDGKNWTARFGPFALKDDPAVAAMARMNDGTVDLVWSLSRQRVAVTNYSAHGEVIIGKYTPAKLSNYLALGARIPGTRTFVDSQNRLWIMGNFTQIFRAHPKDGLKLIYEIDRTEAVHPPLDIGSNGVEDGHGRIWVWSSCAYDRATLKDVYIVSKKKTDLHPNFGPISASKILTIARADDRHMWVSVDGDGLYLVNIDSFATEREPDPAPKAFVSVAGFFLNRGDLYALAGIPWYGGTNELWRRRDGDWTHILPSSAKGDSPTIWCPTAHGILLSGAFGGGPWYIPFTGKPCHLTWRSGFPFERVYGLVRLPDGTFFSCSTTPHSFHGHLRLPPENQSCPRVSEFKSWWPWTADLQGNIWSILEASPNELSQWDGEKWIAHPIPPKLAKSSAYRWRIFCDTFGRIWSHPVDRNTHVFVYDQQGAGRWYDFSKVEDAYLAFKDEPPDFQSNDYLDVPNWPYFGTYSADHKRIALRPFFTQISYYDGSNWHFYKRDQIEAKWNN